MQVLFEQFKKIFLLLLAVVKLTKFEILQILGPKRPKTKN